MSNGTCSGDAAGNRVELLSGKHLGVGAVALLFVRMRRHIGDHEDRFSFLQAAGDVDGASVHGVYATKQSQREIRPLIFLDAAVVNSLKESEAFLIDDWTRFEVDMRAVLVRADHTQTSHDGLGANDDQDYGTVASGDNQAGSGFYLSWIREFGKARSLCQTDDLFS